MLRDFHANNIRDYSVPLGSELKFDIVVEGIPVTGRIDLVRRLPDGGLEVLDYKSGSMATDPDIVKKSLQLSIYQMAVQELYGRVARLSIYNLRTGDVAWVGPRSDGEIKELRQKFVQAAAGIIAEEFEPKLTEDCPCDWPEHCPYFKDRFRGSGQTTLVENRDSVNIDDVVKELEEITSACDPDIVRVKELEDIVRRYMEEAGLMRVYTGDLVVGREKTGDGDLWIRRKQAD
jgi:hypothetical protein